MVGGWPEGEKYEIIFLQFFNFFRWKLFEVSPEGQENAKSMLGITFLYQNFWINNNRELDQMIKKLQKLNLEAILKGKNLFF